MKILLIGGAGFIGSHLAIELKNYGHDVKIFDSFQVNNLGYHLTQRDLWSLGIINKRIACLFEYDIPIIADDARDYHRLSKVFEEWKPEIVIHLAAVSHAGKSNKDPFSTFDHSLRTLENALDAAIACASQFIFFSSSMVYGEFPECGYVYESEALRPLGIYGALKLSGELMVRAYGEVFDLPWTIIRPSALYGPYCVSRRVIQIWVENAFMGSNLFVQGDENEALDFTHVADVVRGVRLMVGNEKAYGEVFNITTGKAERIIDVANYIVTMFHEIYNKSIDVIHSKDREELTPRRGTLKIDKATAILGYLPQFNTEKGLQQYVAWYSNEGFDWGIYDES